MRLVVSTLAVMLTLAAVPEPARGQSCTIPEDQIVSGGPGKDGIPALTRPPVVSAAEGDQFLQPFSLVLGVEVNGEARAYPHNVLWWHEIANDVVGGMPIVVSYCPLTGSGLLMAPTLADQTHNFGVSGLLFDNNLILFDRTTESLWSQLRNEAICGPFRGTKPQLMPIVQSTWAAWKALHPDTTVLSFDTGFSRNYNRYPYGTYDQLFDNSLLFPQSFIDPRREMKELVLGITHEGLSRAYPYGGMGERAVINDDVNGRQIVVVWDEPSQLAVAFDRVLGDQTLSFELVEPTGFPFRIRDVETGTVWSLTGEAVEGEMAGARLNQVATFSAMWFAWASFNPDTEIFLAN